MTCSTKGAKKLLHKESLNNAQWGEVYLSDSNVCCAYGKGEARVEAYAGSGADETLKVTITVYDVATMNAIDQDVYVVSGTDLSEAPEIVAEMGREFVANMLRSATTIIDTVRAEAAAVDILNTIATTIKGYAADLNMEELWNTLVADLCNVAEYWFPNMDKLVLDLIKFSPSADIVAPVTVDELNQVDWVPATKTDCYDFSGELPDGRAVRVKSGYGSTLDLVVSIVVTDGGKVDEDNWYIINEAFHQKLPDIALEASKCALKMAMRATNARDLKGAENVVMWDYLTWRSQAVKLGLHAELAHDIESYCDLLRIKFPGISEGLLAKLLDISPLTPDEQEIVSSWVSHKE